MGQCASETAAEPELWLRNLAAKDGEPVEIVRFKRPVAMLTASPGLAKTKRKPLIDLDAISHFCKKHRIKSFALFGSVLRDDLLARLSRR